MMKKKRSLVTGILLAISLLLMIPGCSSPDGGGTSSETGTSVVFQSAVQIGGTFGTVESTGLTLTFDVDPDTLTADNITVTGATKGALSASGTTRTLAISNITVDNGDTVSVAITSPTGYSLSGSPQTAVVYKLPALTFLSAEQTGGASGTTDTTALTLTFDVNPTILVAGDITVTGAAKGALSGSGTTRTLAISNITVDNGETVSVAITSPSNYSLSGSPKTAVVYRLVRAITFQSAVQTGGTDGTVDSTGLILTFDADPGPLTADEITVTGATAGALTGSSTTRTLALSGITVENGETVSVSIANPVAYTFTGSQTAVVYRGPNIGMAYKGGIIAYIFQSGDTGYVAGETHGLIAAIADQTLSQWITGGSTQTTANGGTSRDLGTGQANTTAMMNQFGYTGGAASVCDVYSSTDSVTGIVYDDWYLPSFDELNQLRINSFDIGGFEPSSYWSSSEYWSEGSYWQGCGWILSGNDSKDAFKNIRAVRTF